MAAPDDLQVEPLRPEDLPDAADLLARSFVDEELFAYLLEDKDKEARERLLRPWFRAMLRTLGPVGAVDVARRSGQLLCVGLRIRPGVFPMTARTQARLALGLGPVIVATLLRAPSFRRLFRFMAALDAVHPREPHWYLAVVGTDPQVQERGIGSLLAIHAVLAAEADGMPCYLETFGEHVKRACERQGFVVTQEFQPFPGGPRGWGLWRPAGGT